MELAMIGLGRMGANMVRRLCQDGHEVVAYDVNPAIADALAGELSGVTAATELAGVLAALPSPRVVWLMVPHQFVDDSIAKLKEAGLSAGDILIDGGNSNFTHTKARGAKLAEDGIEYVDAGTSGGVWGLENGYSLMVGGSDQAVGHITPILKSLAPGPDTGWGHVGPCGSGHYVKMVHNGIEYGMMQAYAEGFDLMAAKDEFNLDTYQIARIWQHGSVVRSWLLDLVADALQQDVALSSLSDWVSDSGEGRWTCQAAIETGTPAPLLTTALYERFTSRGEGEFANKILSAMRYQFGGHHEKPDS